MKGDCSVNNRKGRTFLIYEFEVKLKWEGGLLDGDGLNLDSAKGTMKLGDVSAESLDDLDVEFTSKSRGSPCSEAMRKQGVAAVKAAVASPAMLCAMLCGKIMQRLGLGDKPARPS